jgi:hypothetical protein
MEQRIMTRPESTAVARAARTLIKQGRWAAEMRANGWTVLEPGVRDEVMDALDTSSPLAIAEALEAGGNGEYGADEMRRIAALLDR